MFEVMNIIISKRRDICEPLARGLKLYDTYLILILRVSNYIAWSH